MSILRLNPGEATQEIIDKIKLDSSQPAADFASVVPSSDCGRPKTKFVPKASRSKPPQLKKPT